MTCKVDDCERERHVNSNGIELSTCTKHFLENMSKLKDPEYL